MGGAPVCQTRVGDLTSRKTPTRSSRDWPREGLLPQLLTPHGGYRHRAVGALTGPMLMHLEKRSSATMCSYSFWMARCRRLVLWWRSYRLSNAAGGEVISTGQHLSPSLPCLPHRPSLTSWYADLPCP